MINTIKNIFCLLGFLLALSANTIYAQSESPSEPLYQRVVVDEIVKTTYPLVFGVETEFQQLAVELENGTRSVDVYNDYTPVKKGDIIYISAGYNPDTDKEGYFVREVDRTHSLLWVALFFVAVYLVIAGMRGARSLLALAFAVASVWFVLVPMLVAGYDPLLVGVGLSILILGVAIFVTHGFTVVSVASYLGSLVAIGLTILFAHIAVLSSRVSGLVGDESSTITILYGSSVDLQGLLLASMIIGILGVLDDVAVMQAAMVREFMYEKSHTVKEVFWKAMRVGQEHAAALVNTLVLAYTAVALPLFLIVLAPTDRSFNTAEIPWGMQFSNELFTAELIRSIVGSFGLVITIPIVTALAIVLFTKYPPKERGSHGHHHHH